MFRLLFLLLLTGLAKPDLHGGGAKPNTIPNGKQTLVTVPGFHLLHSTIEAWGDCRLVEYKIVSDTELRMTLEGRRTLEDKDEFCNYRVRNAAGAAASWVIVALTTEQEAERRAREKAAGQAKTQDANQLAGKKWVVHFGDGTETTYLTQGSNADGMPVFRNPEGNTIKIFVRPDGAVTMIEEGCMRTGKLTAGKVEKGESAGSCRHAGAWSARLE